MEHLTDIQRSLLKTYSAAGEPVSVRVFETPPPARTAEGDPRYDAWCADQLARGQASVDLYARGLITVVVPAADGIPDVIEVSDKGRTALAEICD